MVAFVNNEYIPIEKACIGLSDLAIQRAYGIFDFFRTKHNKPLFLDDHLDRFYQSCHKMFLHPVPEKDELKHIISTLLKKNNCPGSGVRITVTGGYAADTYTLALPNLLITQQFLKMPETEDYEKGISIITHPYRREMPGVKSINYMMGVWLQKKVKEANATEVLYYDENSVSEFPRANVFIITHNDCLVTPGNNILKGITRKKVLEFAGKFCNGVEERDLTLEELKNAKEVFLTSTTKRLMPVCKIDGVNVGNGKAGLLTLELNQYFMEMEEAVLAELF